jgi:GT2 family glycosyltransferase
VKAHLLRPALKQFAVSASEEIGQNDAIWVGSIDIEKMNPGQDLELEDGSRFRTARLLIWDSNRVRGFVDLKVTSGIVDANELFSSVCSLPDVVTGNGEAPTFPISVIVCTRDRPAELSSCLAALLDLQHSDFEIIVVDNAPTTDAARTTVEQFANRNVRYIREDIPGLSRARNAGVRVAQSEYLAFTDDDVIVDSRWLNALTRGFALDDRIGCVTGLVASGQLESASQRYFDRRVAWAKNTGLTLFRLDDPPEGFPLFPFQFGAYGTGANFAAKRSLLFEIGGFDEALGVGSPTGGAEDIDWFTRVVLEGHALLHQPDAVVWHKHRVDDQGLSAQLENYGLGVGAVIAKLAGNSKARRSMAPKIVRAILHTRSILKVEGVNSSKSRSGHGYREFRGMLRGPWALFRARRHGLPRPLLSEMAARSKSWG